jgi:hypothetical protein
LGSRRVHLEERPAGGTGRCAERSRSGGRAWSHPEDALLAQAGVWIVVVVVIALVLALVLTLYFVYGGS